MMAYLRRDKNRVSKMSQSSKNSQLRLNIMLAISKTFVLSLSVLDSLVAKQAEIPEVQAH